MQAAKHSDATDAGSQVSRDEAIAMIRTSLRHRSGRAWSVTGGRGTAWGWITIESPPVRRTWRHRLIAGRVTDEPENYEAYDSGKPGGYMSPADCVELSELLGVDVHHQGVSIPAGLNYRREYVDRADGREPRVCGEPYWD